MADPMLLSCSSVPASKRPKLDSASSDTSEMLNQLLELPDDLLGDTLTLGSGPSANSLNRAVNTFMADQPEQSTAAGGMIPGAPSQPAMQPPLANSTMNSQPSAAVGGGFAPSPHPLGAPSPTTSIVSTSADPTPTLPSISSSPATSNALATPSPSVRPSFSPTPPGINPALDAHRATVAGNPPPYFSPSPSQSPAPSPFSHSPGMPMGMRPTVRIGYASPQMPGHVSPHPHPVDMGHSATQGFSGLHPQVAHGGYNPHTPGQTFPHTGPMMGPSRPPLPLESHPPQGMPPPQGVGAPGVGGAPSGGASNDPEKRKLIQQQLVLLLHAHRCQQREREQQANGEFRPCGLPHCRTMKNVLNHMTECQAGRDCTFPHCASSRQIIFHWKNCQQQECPVCLPLKNASLAHKRDSMPQGPMPGPALNLPQSMMPRMNPNASPGYPHTGPTHDMGYPRPSSVGPPGPGGLVRSLAIPNHGPGMEYVDYSPVANVSRLVGDARPAAAHPLYTPSLSLSRPPQPWHQVVTSEVRSHLIKKLVEAIYSVPVQDPLALQDPRVASLVQYAINVEKSMFENATSREEYYQLLAERIYRIRKELDERKRLKRIQASGTGTPTDSTAILNGGPEPGLLPGSTPQPGTPLHQGTPSVPEAPLGSPPLTSDEGASTLKSLMSSTVPLSSLKGLSTSPTLPQRPSSDVPPPAGLEMKKEAPEEMLLRSLDTSGSQQPPLPPAAPATDSSGGKPSSVQSSGSPAMRQRLSSLSDPHSIQPISSVKSERSEGAPPSAPLQKSNLAKIQPDPTLKVSFSAQELEAALRPVFQQVWEQDPEAYPFRQPVDPKALGIPDYFEIIRDPIDLSVVDRKLRQGGYANPWKFCEDMWLMFDNAWLYNKKTSRVYKFCTKLSEVFDEYIDEAMQSLGYCCGRRHAFHPQVLYCNGKPLCTVPRDSPYHGYKNKCVYCPKCFSEMPGDSVTVRDGSVQNIPKSAFKELKNDSLEYEPLVECIHCQRQMHRICVLHHDSIWPEGFQCNNCLRSLKTTHRENKFTAKRLPTTKLGNFLENRVNGFLRNASVDAGEVTIRVVSSSDKILDTRMGMRDRFAGEFPAQFPYRTKALFAFEEIDGVDVCFFGMHVQEYGSDCPAPNTRRVYISYLDSVHFFRPKQYRTLVYHELLIGYLDFCKHNGFQTAHIWACPPGEGDDYIFHCHPIEQKIPKPKRLVDWYRKMLDRGKQSYVVYDYKDIFRHCTDEEITTVTEIPYFEGDFWPNVVEETIKELDMEEEEERKASEAASVDVNRTGPKKAGKRSTNKKGSKKAGASRAKNSKKSGLIIGGDTLSQKIYQTMEKHKEVFFVVLLQPPTQSSPLPATTDPDSLITCDLMDGRDAFLNLAREKHWEFSSLRRGKFSTQALLYELHNQGGDRFVYTCNSCRSDIETRWHCAVCEDFDLCDSCYKITGHNHPMERLEYEPGDSEAPQTNTAEARNHSIRRRIEYLIHASQCRDANCRQPYCIKMKQLLRHTRDCKLRASGTCMICKHFILLCVTHARECKETKCMLPVCASIKQKLREQRQQQQNRNFDHVTRRMHRMAAIASAAQGSSPSSNSSPGNKSVRSPAATQSPCPQTAPTPGKVAAASPNPLSVGKGGPRTPGDIATPKPPPSVTIPPSPMTVQNPATPFHPGTPYTPMNKPQETSPNMTVQQPPINRMQPTMVNPEDNIQRVVEAYLSINPQDKMRAVNYLKNHQLVFPRAVHILRQQGRMQEAYQLQLDTGLQVQQQPGYMPQSTLPQQQQGPYIGPSQMPIHQQPMIGVPQRQMIMSPQQQMVHHQPMQQPGYPHPAVMQPQPYGNSMMQPQRMATPQMYTGAPGNPAAGPMSANPPTQHPRLSQMLQSRQMTPQQYHNPAAMQYGVRMGTHMPGPNLGPPPQYTPQPGTIVRQQTQPGYPMMGHQPTMGRTMGSQPMMPGAMPSTRPVPIGFGPGMQDPNMAVHSLYQQQPPHPQQIPYGMNSNNNNSSSSYLLGQRTPPH